MYIDNIITTYIDRVTPNDIKEIAKLQNIPLNSDEINYLFNYAHNNWYELVHSTDFDIFSNIKAHINTDAYNKLEQLYLENKAKYKDYL